MAGESVLKFYQSLKIITHVLRIPKYSFAILKIVFEQKNHGMDNEVKPFYDIFF